MLLRPCLPSSPTFPRPASGRFRRSRRLYPYPPSPDSWRDYPYPLDTVGLSAWAADGSPWLHQEVPPYPGSPSAPDPTPPAPTPLHRPPAARRPPYQKESCSWLARWPYPGLASYFPPGFFPFSVQIPGPEPCCRPFLRSATPLSRPCHRYCSCDTKTGIAPAGSPPLSPGPLPKAPDLLFRPRVLSLRPASRSGPVRTGRRWP